MAVVLSGVYLIFIRFCSGIFVWAIILVYFACLGALGYLFWDEEIGKNVDSVQNMDPETKKNIAYGIWGFAAVCLLVFICML